MLLERRLVVVSVRQKQGFALVSLLILVVPDSTLWCLTTIEYIDQYRVEW